MIKYNNVIAIIVAFISLTGNAAKVVSSNTQSYLMNDNDGFQVLGQTASGLSFDEDGKFCFLFKSTISSKTQTHEYTMYKCALETHGIIDSVDITAIVKNYAALTRVLNRTCRECLSFQLLSYNHGFFLLITPNISLAYGSSYSLSIVNHEDTLIHFLHFNSELKLVGEFVSSANSANGFLKSIDSIDDKLYAFYTDRIIDLKTGLIAHRLYKTGAQFLVCNNSNKKVLVQELFKDSLSLCPIRLNEQGCVKKTILASDCNTKVSLVENLSLYRSILFRDCMLIPYEGKSDTIAIYNFRNNVWSKGYLTHEEKLDAPFELGVSGADIYAYSTIKGKPAIMKLKLIDQ